MDFLKSSKRRSLVSEVVYVALNIALAVAVLVTILVTNSPLLAFAVVLLGKWRVLAVRPRYWFANVQANLVDVIVSLGIVVLIYQATGAVTAQAILTLFYIGWLLFIKPRSKRLFIAVQAGCAILLGTLALATVSYDWIASAVVIGMWVIGYGAVRHVLSSYDESHTMLYSLIGGFVFAELGWLTYHWTFAYNIPGVGDIKLAQVSLIALGLSFLMERAYASYAKHKSVQASDMVLPTLLTLSVIAILILFFNDPTVGSGLS